MKDDVCVLGGDAV